MLTGLFIFLLLVVILLGIPVRLQYQLSFCEAFEYTLRLSWLFGLVQITFPLLEEKKFLLKNIAVRKIMKQKKETLDRKKKSSSQRKIDFLSTVHLNPFRQRAVKLVNDLWRAIKKQELHLSMRIGLDDPADTGKLWSLLGPVSAAISNIKKTSIQIEPEFTKPVFQLNSRGSFQVIPLQLIYLVITALLSPSLWQGIKQM